MVFVDAAPLFIATPMLNGTLIGKVVWAQMSGENDHRLPHHGHQHSILGNH